MAKKLTSTKAKKILHDKEVHGQPLTDKQRRFFGAIAGGAKPYKAQNGIEGTMGGLTDIGFNYNGAWGGTMQNGGLTFLQPTSRKLPKGYVIPYNTPSTELAMSIGGEGNELAYLIPSFKGGKSLKDPVGEFRKTGEHLGGPFKTWQEADEWERTVRHPYVEKGQSIPTPLKRWGKDFAMGGSLPGAVGFMYARTQGAAPNNGPYAKKTKASAQNGAEMKYYQQGLDFKPKTISKKGSKIKKDDDGYWNPENWGEPVEISSPFITMEGVYEPLLGISDTGDTQLMFPGEDYEFDGESVTEYPIGKTGVSVNKADEAPLKKLDQLLNFTNYNEMAKAKKGKKLSKAQFGSYIGGESKVQQPFDFRGVFDDLDYMATGKTNAMRAEEARLAKLNADQDQQYYNSQNTGGLSMMFGKHGVNVPKYQYGGPLPFIDEQGLVQAPGGVVTQDQTNYLESIGAMQPVGGQYTQQGQSKKQKSLATTAAGRLLDKGINALGPIAKPIGQVVNAARKVDQSIKQAQKARQAGNLAKLAVEASSTGPEETKRRYVRPEDNLIQPGQVGNAYGTGMGFLAKNGMQVGGNLTEIQNMYNPGDIYMDLGYEPMDDSNQVKQYKKGGKVKMADGGETLFNIASNPTFDKIGKYSTIGGDVVSGFIDIGTERRMKQNQQLLGQAAFQQGTQSLQNQYSSVMEDGGGLKYLSHDWQPQVITKFGDYDLKDLLAPPKDADMLRSGGHLKDYSYTEPSKRALQTYAMGGELQTHWGGDAETISENPYLPDGGETIMFRGQSHEEADGKGRTGIGITFGDNPVEVERGEPAVKLKDGGTGEDSLVVFGNMKIPSYGVSELEDDKAKGKKFKHYAADLSKIEKKAEKTSDKALEIIDDVDGYSPFDLLKLNTGKAMLQGSDTTYKEVADKKNILAGVQNAILDTAKEQGLESDALAKGKIKKAKDSDMAKFGKSINKAQKGKNINIDMSKFLPTAEQVAAEDAAFRAANPEPVSSYDPYSAFLQNEHPIEKFESITDLPTAKELKELEARKKKTLLDKGLEAYDTLYPYIKPGIRNPLDPGQLAGEMYALATNQLEPVQAQTYTPLLEEVPTVSFQDQLNEIQAQANAAMRLTGNNPAAQASIASQAAAAKNKVLAEQFRTNQSLQLESRRRNLATLNDATLKNLAILDQQYQRQAQAKSATKTQAFEALSSIAEKIAKNKAETLSANVMANMYPQFSYGPQGRIYSTGVTKFNIPTIADYTTEDLQKILDARKVEDKKKKPTTGKNGSIVKAIKNL